MKMRLERLLKPLFLSFGFLCTVVVAQAQQYCGSRSYFLGEDEIIISEIQISRRDVTDEKLTISYYTPRNCRKTTREVYIVYPCCSTNPCCSSRRKEPRSRTLTVSYYSVQNPCPPQTYCQETYSGEVRRIITTTTTTTTYY